MKIFRFGKKNKRELTEEEKKHNKMWELWVNGEAASPFAELMTYQSEVNNGGHLQYFDSIGSADGIEKETAAIATVLSEKLKNNLENAYNAYLALCENEDDKNAETVMERCDSVFYENDEEIDGVLEEYAAEMKL